MSADYVISVSDWGAWLKGEEPEAVPLHLYRESGLRICLGGDADSEAPDIVLEREGECWRIFIHPDPGNDPAYVLELWPATTRVFNDAGEELHETLRPWREGKE